MPVTATAAGATAAGMAAASSAATAASTAAMTNLLYMSLAATAASALTGVAGSIMQSKNASAQAKAQSAAAQQQANIQRQNAQLQEQQASAERRQGYEDMLKTRQDAARKIAADRAASGASGMAVDFGSFADVADESMQRAEIDAVNAYNKGIDKGYNSEISAWNYGQQAVGYDAQASAYNRQASQASMAGGLGALQAGIGGIADGISTWGKFYTPTPGQYTYDPALGSYVKGGKTWTH